MTMVRPVLREDPFAGVGWNTSLALLALEKFRVSETLYGDERQSIRNTMVFVGSLSPCSTDVFSVDDRRSVMFWAKAPQGLQREQLKQLEQDLIEVSRLIDYSVTPDAKLAGLLERTRETVLSILEVVNRCRR